MRLKLKTTLVLASLMAFQPVLAHADDAFRQTLRSIWSDARSKGVSEATFNRALGNVRFDQEVIDRATHQPEFTRPIWEYLESAVSAQRIENGRQMLQRHARDLDLIEERFGVDRHILVAIWGIESSYGAVLNNRNIVRDVIQSLATLAHAGPRNYKNFGRTQLVAALQILEAGDIPIGQMTGSWAGAMGHTQFIPTSYLAYAVDMTGDGKRDIWNSPADALGSAASLLSRNGWRRGETWGYEVRLPQNFNFALGDGRTNRSLSEWARLGLQRPSGIAFPRPDDQAYLLLPAGARGPAFLMLRNFDVIKRYNNATSYAIAVGHLADRLRGGGAFASTWPRGERPLSRSQVEELQAALNRRGFNVGNVDGRIGPATMAGIRAYQSSRGMTPDGFATQSLLSDLKR